MPTESTNKSLDAASRFPVEWLFFGAALLPWVWVLTYLSHAWRESSEYHFGFFVPILSLVLLWTRRPWDVSSRPRLFPRTGLVLWIVAVPIVILGESFHSDLVYSSVTGWCWTLGAFALSTGLLLRSVGIGNWRRMVPAMIVAVMATPLPRGLWGTISLRLQSWVTEWTTDLLFLLNVPAFAKGNVIVTQNGWVGITEACSGLRSLQAVILFSLFLGCLVLRRNVTRAWLMICGVLVVMLANLARSTWLVLMVHREGSSALSALHDTAGHSVLLASMIALSLLATILVQWEPSCRTKKGSSPLPVSSQPPTRLPRPFVGSIPVGAYASMAYVALLLPVVSWSLGASSEVSRYRDWRFVGDRVGSASGYDVESRSPETYGNLLLFSRASDSYYLEKDRFRWRIFNAQWDAGRVSNASVGVHVPQICFPMGGWTASGTSWIEPVSMGSVSYRTLWQYFKNQHELMLVGFLHLVAGEPRVFLNPEKGWLHWKVLRWDLYHPKGAPQEVFIFSVRMNSPGELAPSDFKDFLNSRYSTDQLED